MFSRGPAQPIPAHTLNSTQDAVFWLVTQLRPWSYALCISLSYAWYYDTTWGQSVNKTVTKGAHLGGVLHARRHLQRHQEAGKGRVRRIQSLCRAGWAHLGGVLHARRHLQRHREAGKGRVRRIQSLCRAGWASQSRWHWRSATDGAEFA